MTPCFHSTATIRDTIESVRCQELLKEYPHLLWVSEKDDGHYLAMNKGIDRATGEVSKVFAKGRRQLQKLRLRGQCDLVSGKWLLRKHLHEKTTYSSNIGLDKR